MIMGCKRKLHGKQELKETTMRIGNLKETSRKMATNGKLQGPWGNSWELKCNSEGNEKYKETTSEMGIKLKLR